MKGSLCSILFVLLSSCGLLGPKGTAATDSGHRLDDLSGKWSLTVMALPEGTIKDHYPAQVPFISFDPSLSRFNGNTGCNSFNGKLNARAEDRTIRFDETIAMTRMSCPGKGEELFLKTLAKVNHYSVSQDGKRLSMIRGDIVLMQFDKNE